MNTKLKWISFFLAVLILPALCQASVTILSNASPDHTVTSGSDEQVYGTSASNQIILESGAKAELINFPGQNVIEIQPSSDSFTVFRSGTVVTFQDDSGTLLKIPATTDPQTIEFADQDVLTLSIHNGQVMLDDQVITTTPVYLGDPELSVSPSSRNVDSESGTTTFSVSNTGVDTMAWTAEVNSGNNWLTIISSGSGYDDGTITCQYEANTETDPRIGTLQITAPYATGSPVNVTVEQAGVSPTDGCGAYVTPEVWKKFDCYNLAAAGKDTEADPFTPSWELIGGYWQWGQAGPFSTQWLNINTANFAHGPTGPDSQEANAGAIDAWSQTPAPSGAWSDTSKATDDPCPSGYRMPTESQWGGVVENNAQTATGTWSNSATNYASARFFGDELMLPATGTRNYSDGALYFRGIRGNYWSSTESTSDNAKFLSFDSSSAETDSNYKTYGYSVRCIAEPLSLGTDQVTLQSGESKTVNISGGTGNYTSVTSSNDEVASATLGINTIMVTGVFRGTGTITVEDSGGSTAFLTVMVDTSPYSCGAYIAPGIWKEFDCYNLAAIGKTFYEDPFTPSWRLIGGYWQWGRKGPDPDQWYNTNTENFAHGPTSPYEEGANDGSISEWYGSGYAPDVAWSDAEKTDNDPCPTGFRVPTISQWEGVVENNIQIAVGTWDSGDTNYSSARFFGNDLMLPAAGYRNYSDGRLVGRGYGGYYVSPTTRTGYASSMHLYFDGGNVGTGSNWHKIGRSVRCVAE
jgi:uncharacterized protein (TIGR02145 family)